MAVTLASRKFIGGVPMKPPTNMSAGFVTNLARRIHLDDPPGVRPRDPVAHAERLDLVVGHVDRGDVEVPKQALQLGPHLQRQERVEVLKRLLREYHVGLRRARACDSNALALRARDLRRVPLEEVLDVQHGSPGRRGVK